MDGMTDLQFKSYLRLLIHALDTAASQDTKEKMLAELAKIKQDLQAALDS